MTSLRGNGAPSAGLAGGTQQVCSGRQRGGLLGAPSLSCRRFIPTRQSDHHPRFPHPHHSQGPSGIRGNGQLLPLLPARDRFHHGASIPTTSRQTQGPDVGPISSRCFTESKRRPRRGSPPCFCSSRQDFDFHHGPQQHRHWHCFGTNHSGTVTPYGLPQSQTPQG